MMDKDYIERHLEARIQALMDSVRVTAVVVMSSDLREDVWRILG